MSFPPPTVLPPPTPAVWAPRFRALLARLLLRLDRRKARILARKGITIHDVAWREAYREWWFADGWKEGAKPPKDVWDDLIRQRADEAKVKP